MLPKDINSMINELKRIINKKERKIIGLMSGTSADSVDAALVLVKGHGLETKAELLQFHRSPFDPDLREEIFKLFDAKTATVEKICRMNFLLGELFAEAAKKVTQEAGISMDEVDLIGSHGQTIYHLPQPTPLFGYKIRSSLQIGEPSVIADRTGVMTVANFRARDIAAGGEGAPLVPYVDYLLFRSSEKSIGLLNIGGIANITVIPRDSDLEEVYAFDTGPGNMIIDYTVNRITDGALNYDQDGQMALSGHSDPALLTELLKHPYFARKPPKSTGREEFGAHYAGQLLRDSLSRGLTNIDLITTLTRFTAKTIALGINRFAPGLEEIIVSGGGGKNPAIINFLNEELPEKEIRFLEDCDIFHGSVWAGQAKEALAFAILANETIFGHSTNLPRVTGAKHMAVLGTIVPGRETI